MSETLATDGQIEQLLTTAIDHTMSQGREVPHAGSASTYFWVGEAEMTLPETIRVRADLTPEEATNYFPQTIFNKSAYRSWGMPLVNIDLHRERPVDRIKYQDWIRYQIKLKNGEPVMVKHLLGDPIVPPTTEEVAIREEYDRKKQEIFDEHGVLTAEDLTDEVMEKIASLEGGVNLSDVIRNVLAGEIARNQAEEMGLMAVYADEAEALQEVVISW